MWEQPLVMTWVENKVSDKCQRMSMHPLEQNQLKSLCCRGLLLLTQSQYEDITGAAVPMCKSTHVYSHCCLSLPGSSQYCTSIVHWPPICIWRGGQAQFRTVLCRASKSAKTALVFAMLSCACSPANEALSPSATSLDPSICRTPESVLSDCTPSPSATQLCAAIALLLACWRARSLILPAGHAQGGQRGHLRVLSWRRAVPSKVSVWL